MHDESLRVTVTLPRSVFKLIEKTAAKTGRSRSSTVSDLVRRGFRSRQETELEAELREYYGAESEEEAGLLKALSRAAKNVRYDE